MEGFGMGAGAFALGWTGAAIRGGRSFLRPPQGSVGQSGSKVAMSGKNCQQAVRDPAQAWYKSTFKTAKDSLAYHYDKHALRELCKNPLQLGKTPAIYSRDAQKFFQFYKNSGYAKIILLKDGSSGIRISLGKGLPGGIYTHTGKIVSFWYV